ncbi:hypothetical protein TNCV_3884141 [Trichonephila clavipes]|nr:hypothetical protein TNCV_3884141 [Trichonephila clavipes]
MACFFNQETAIRAKNITERCLSGIDNAKPYTARLVEKFLEAETIHSIWSHQHGLLMLILPNMFGLLSNYALMQDQRILLLSKTWGMHFVNIEAIFPKEYSISSSHICLTSEW